MNGGVRLSIAGVMLALLALAGCGRSFLQGERAAWRHEAEVACMKAGTVKLGGAVVQMQPIEGPGMCGADFPLKVAALGEANPAMSYSDDLVPPGAIPNAPARMPNWPPQQRYAPPPSPPATRVEVAPGRNEVLQWRPGAQAVVSASGEPMPLNPSPPAGAPVRAVPAAPMRAAPAAPYPQPQARAVPDDIPPDAVIPPGGSAAVPQQRVQPGYPPPPRDAYNAPVYEAPAREPPRLGPSRAPFTAVAATQAELTPAATLACPLVSALDRWVTDGVQPAAQRWFGSLVVTIKQISAYSCRAMVGASSHNISEHAFGNALDIAAFTLADGRTITVVNGWHGSPEEQGFLHDVHLAACETFSTVLAPGYNAAHYNHIHVDLMRRASGNRPCRPEAIPGEQAAAQARTRYANKHGPLITGSVKTLPALGKMMEAVPGEDGDVDEDDVANVAPSPVSRAPVSRPRAPQPIDRQTQVY